MNTDFKAAMQQYQRIRMDALDKMRRDSRFHAMVMSAVGSAMQEHGLIDPQRADQAARKIAMTAAAFVLARAFDEDAEVKAAHAERDAYRKLAEDALRLSP